MKFLLIALLGAIAATAQDCTLTPHPGIRCMGTDDDGEQFEVNVTKCGCYSHRCCEYENTCVACRCEVPVEETEDPSVEEDGGEDFATAFFDGANPVIEQAHNSFSRSLLVLPPGIPQLCRPPVPFPGKCKPQRNEPYVLEPPVNVPYCVRIPCDAQDNSVYDENHRMCGMQPGCYFDKPLFEYRKAFGPSVLPGVPVCHLAIRNIVFKTKAKAVIDTYGSWNPYFTNCLLNEFDSEIRKGPVGCELLPVVEAFSVTPKFAGWKNIASYACALIDGCYVKGRGCFYPVDISNVRVKSGERSISAIRNEVVYGRPKCQHFDNSSPTGILKSYHACLSAGCSVDYSVTRLYYSHLFKIGEGLTSKNHWNYWDDVLKGLVGPYNIHEVLGEYGYKGAGIRENDGRFPCGIDNKLYGGRPCPPTLFNPAKKTNHCPYKPFKVPRFPVLKGSFAGCCDINLCYLPKKAISNMHSGPARYHTEWSTWSSCSATCGVGTKKRYRKCVSQDRSLCTDKEVDAAPCRGLHRVCGGWSRWTDWTPCPYTCFPGGNQVRRRRCQPIGSKCDGHDEEARSCGERSCLPDNGPVGEWSNWMGTTCTYLANEQKCQHERVRRCLYQKLPASNCAGGPAIESQKILCHRCA